MKLKWFILTSPIISDLTFWLKYIQILSTISLYSIIHYPNESLFAFTDASSYAGGFIIDKKWAFFHFNHEIIKLHINLKEMFVVLKMIRKLKQFLSNKKITVFIDNQSVFHAIERRWSNNPVIMDYIYKLSIILIKYNISL